MNKEFVCSYSHSEEFTWYVDTYDFQPTLLTATTRARCRFCSSEMNDRTDKKNEFFLELCKLCGFWRVVNLRGLGGFRNGEPQAARRGVAKFYDIGALDVPVADLRRFLIKHPHHISNVNPYAFEELVADCMRSAFTNCDIIKVGGRKDRGIDLIIISTSGEKYLAQIKRRSNINKSESVHVVRQLNGVLFRENVAKGLVVTTARKYTADATKETWVTTPHGEEGAWQSIELYGFEDIVKWLDLPPCEDDEPWSSFTEGKVLSELL